MKQKATFTVFICLSVVVPVSFFCFPAYSLEIHTEVMADYELLNFPDPGTTPFLETDSDAATGSDSISSSHSYDGFGGSGEVVAEATSDASANSGEFAVLATFDHRHPYPHEYSATATWSEAFTNTNSVDLMYTFDLDLVDGLLFAYGDMDSAYYAKAGYSIYILLDSVSIWSSSATFDMQADPGSPLTETGTELGWTRENPYQNGPQTYTMPSYNETLSLGTCAEGEGFNLEYQLTVEVWATDDYITTATASFGDPGALVGLSGLVNMGFYTPGSGDHTIELEDIPSISGFESRGNDNCREDRRCGSYRPAEHYA